MITLLDQRLKTLKISQAALARKNHISRAKLCQVEKGKAIGPKFDYDKYAAMYGLSKDLVDWHPILRSNGSTYSRTPQRSVTIGEQVAPEPVSEVQHDQL